MSFRNVTVLDASGPDVPIEVYEAIRDLWKDYGFGNDYYYVPWYADDDCAHGENKYQVITDYITNMGENPNDGNVLIHFWW